MNRTARLLSAATLACLLTAGCSDAPPGDSPDLMTPRVRPPLGAPIDAPPGAWTWVDFPDTVCNEGTPTGLAISKAASNNVLVFLMGGGACWDYATCYLLMTAATGPVRKQEFDGVFKGGQSPAGTIFDRSANNPFKDWNLVFVPYCTGDVHSGDNVGTYPPDGMNQKTWRHKGRPNLEAYLKRLAATWPSPDKLVVSGSSAGGFGSALNYDLFRTYFPTGKGYLLDDSGPPLIGDAIPQSLRDSWFKSWRLDLGLGVFCPTCNEDMTAAIPLLAKAYPADRFALLSSTQDQTIRGFFLQSGADFQTNLFAMAKQVLDPLPSFHYFIETGEFHTMLGSPATHTSSGVKLLSWISQMVADDPAWTSVKP